jgi:hypothetical protein
MSGAISNNHGESANRRVGKLAILILLFSVMMVLVIATAEARGGRGGRGGGGYSGGSKGYSSVSSANRGMSSRPSASTRPSTGAGAGNINIDNDIHVDPGYGYGNRWGGGWGYHPIAAGAFIGAIAVTTAAVIGFLLLRAAADRLQPVSLRQHELPSLRQRLLPADLQRRRCRLRHGRGAAGRDCHRQVNTAISRRPQRAAVSGNSDLVLRACSSCGRGFIPRSFGLETARDPAISAFRQVPVIDRRRWRPSPGSGDSQIGPRSHCGLAGCCPIFTSADDTLRRIPMMRTLIAALFAIGFAGVAPAEVETSSPDGLDKVSIEGIDVAYKRPGASMDGYNKIRIGSITVSFNKNWEKTPLPGTRFKMHSEDAQKIKDRLAGAMREEFTAALKAGGYEVVDTAGEDVLEFAAAIADLYINKPDVQSAARADTYAVSAGEMVLVAELRDSASGEVMVRAYDRGQARKTQTPHFITGSENEKEARKILQDWSTILVRQLNAARGKAAS